MGCSEGGKWGVVRCGVRCGLGCVEICSGCGRIHGVWMCSGCSIDIWMIFGVCSGYGVGICNGYGVRVCSGYGVGIYSRYGVGLHHTHL